MRITYRIKPGDVVRGTMTGRIRIILRIELETIYYMQTDRGVVTFDWSTHEASHRLDHWIHCGWELVV